MREHVQMMFNNGLLKHRDDGGYDVVEDAAERKKLQQDYINSSKAKMQSELDE